MSDEIIKFEGEDGRIIKVKKIITPSQELYNSSPKETWQIFNEASSSWLVKSKSAILRFYKENVIQKRNVLIEKKGYVTKKEY